MAIQRRAFMATAASAVVAPFIARAQPRVVQLGYANSDKSHFGAGARTFAAAVAADPALSGIIQIERRGNFVLGDELALLNGCMDGKVDMTLIATQVVGAKVPEIGLMDTPFLFRTAEIARKALDGDVGSELMAAAQLKGISILAWGENGIRHITSNRPVRTPADLVGLKMRVPQSDVELECFRALGADAQPLPFPALHEALRTGVFEAQENPIGIIETGRLYDVQKYLSLTGHIYNPALFQISADLKNSLSSAQLQALMACARQGAAAMRQAAEASQRDGLQRLRTAGMELVADIDVAAFAAASQPSMVALGQKYGTDQMQRLIRAGA